LRAALNNDVVDGALSYMESDDAIVVDLVKQDVLDALNLDSALAKEIVLYGETTVDMAILSDDDQNTLLEKLDLYQNQGSLSYTQEAGIITIDFKKDTILNKLDVTSYTSRQATVYNRFGQQSSHKEESYSSSSEAIKNLLEKNQILYDPFGREISYLETNTRKGESTQVYDLQGRELQDYLLGILERLNSAPTFSGGQFESLVSTVSDLIDTQSDIDFHPLFALVMADDGGALGRIPSPAFPEDTT
ncbi:MAG: hypothetical protein GY816_13650, partial [Cytophagales bacterium]|nr:hypothetical protein [Cytophagales bacterium]